MKIADRSILIAGVAAALAALGGCTAMAPSTGMKEDPVKTTIDAKAVLRQAVESTDPETRAAAIEAMADVTPAQGGPLFRQMLDDPSPSVRFAAAMGIGDIRYAPAKPVLVEKAKVNVGEQDKRVFCAVIYALHCLGEDSYNTPLADLLFDPEPAVRSNAAMVMGRMGEPSAIGPLKAARTDEQDEGAKINMTEALSLLGDARSTDLLQSYAKGYYLDIRLAAIPALAHQATPRTMQLLRDLLRDSTPPRVCVTAAGALAKLGETDRWAYNYCIACVRDPAKVVREAWGDDKTVSRIEVGSLQRLAAIALGWMNQTEAVDSLSPLLTSKDGPVRAAAAMSILRLLAPLSPKSPLQAPAAAPLGGPAPRPPLSEPSPPSLPRLKTAGGKG